MAKSPQLTSIGYQWLIEHFQVAPIPHFVESYLSKPNQRRTETSRDGRCQEIYPYNRFKAETVFDHLEFALKREGLHLELLRMVLPRVLPQVMTDYVKATPTGKYVRVIWYLYERFSGETLPIPDLTVGNYEDLLDGELYFTGPVEKLPRWRINRNLLHTTYFSPMLRRTEKLSWDRDEALAARCCELVKDLPPEIFQRAVRFLYAKETRTSYEIEQETPSPQRGERFMAVLSQAGEEKYLTKEGLVELQNTIVEPRFQEADWRNIQNFVGQTLAAGMEELHLIPPKPEDLEKLMTEWLKVARYLSRYKSLPPIASAAIVSWLFVYFHPFEDGNGRIHRFLIHHVLARRGFGPEGVPIPVSAVLLNKPASYDASLETFSKLLKEHTEWEFDDHHLVVTNETIHHFRYIDCTAMAEALYDFIEEAIEKELPHELRFLQYYDDARRAMREIVDLPETTASLILRLCLQNQGRLSQTKRKLPAFEKLTPEEISALEKVIQESYRLNRETMAVENE